MKLLKKMKKVKMLERLTVNIDNINTFIFLRDEDKFIANKIEKVLYKKNITKRRYYKNQVYLGLHKRIILKQK